MALIASDRRTLIVGLGETGLACVRHCHGLGRSVSVVDSRNQPPALSRLEQAFPEVPVQTGAFDPDYFRGFDELTCQPRRQP
jgi:UDP-N-acetylmuramoylalanine-D-glutamate ligase